MRTQEQILKDTCNAIEKVTGKAAARAFERNWGGCDLPDDAPSEVIRKVFHFGSVPYPHDFWGIVQKKLVAMEEQSNQLKPQPPTQPDDEVMELWLTVFKSLYYEEGVEYAANVADEATTEFKKRFK